MDGSKLKIKAVCQSPGFADTGILFAVLRGRGSLPLELLSSRCAPVAFGALAGLHRSATRGRSTLTGGRVADKELGSHDCYETAFHLIFVLLF